MILTSIAALSLGACGAGSTPTPASTATPTESPTATPTQLPFVDIMVTLGQAFQMGPKHTAFVDPDGFRIDYVGVVSDSRCARDVQCITAGRAVVEFAIATSTSAPLQSYLFGIGDAGPEPPSHDVGGYRISLTQLDPLPHSDGRLLDYRATLVVTDLAS